MNLFFLTLLTIFSSSINAAPQNSSAQWWLALELASDMTNALQTLTSLSLVDKNMDRLSKERRRHHQFIHFNRQVARHCDSFSRIKFMSKTFSKFVGTFLQDTDSIEIGRLKPECFKVIAKGIRFLPHITKLIVKEPYIRQQTMSKVELYQEIQDNVHILFNQTNNIDTIVFDWHFTEWKLDFTTLNITNVKNWEFGEYLNENILSRYSFIPRANIGTLTLRETQLIDYSPYGPTSIEHVPLSLEMIKLLDKMPGLKTLHAQSIGDDIFRFKSSIIEELTIYADEFNKTLLKNFPNMHKMTVLEPGHEFWTKLNSIERQFTCLVIKRSTLNDPYSITSALSKQKQLNTLAIDLTEVSFNGISQLMHNSYIEHLSLVTVKDIDISFLHHAKALTSLSLAISPTEFNFLQIENILKSSLHLKKIKIIQKDADDQDIETFLNFYERLLAALSPKSELVLVFNLFKRTNRLYRQDQDDSFEELLKEMGLISAKYLAKELIINGIEIKEFVNGLLDYESLPVSTYEQYCMNE